MTELCIYPYILSTKFMKYFCNGCRTVTRELVTLAYFLVCLRRSLITRASSEVSARVSDRLTPPPL